MNIHTVSDRMPVFLYGVSVVFWASLKLSSVWESEDVEFILCWLRNYYNAAAMKFYGGNPLRTKNKVIEIKASRS